MLPFDIQRPTFPAGSVNADLWVIGGVLVVVAAVLVILLVRRSKR